MRRGFSLLELSIVLLIIGLIIGGMVTLTGYTQATQYNATVARMDEIEKALFYYASAFNRIPCPSSLTALAGTSTYGAEAANKGSCWGGTPAASFKAASGTVEGGVPTRILQLPDAYQYDGWGNRFRYAVDPTMTATNAFPTYPLDSSCSSASASAITVTDASGVAGNRTTAGIYAIVSHGANGHGAFTSSGAIVNAGSVNTGEQTNCHCNSSGAATTYTPTYVEKLSTVNTANAFDSFDDIVTFKEGWQMQAQNFPLKTCVPQYIYVTDSTNCTVQKFNSSGSFLMSFGSCGTSNGQFKSAAGGVAVDSTGNIWVADSAGARVEKFNSGGTYLSQLGGCSSGDCTPGSGNGVFRDPMAVRIDASGNIWVSDIGNGNCQEFNASGTWLAALPTGALPYDFAFDSAGNIWEIHSNAAPYIEEINTSGTLLTSFGSSGTANGQFKDGILLGIAVTASGNIWASDTGEFDAGGDRFEQFNSSGTYLSQIGCSSGDCSTGSGNGQLNKPGHIAIDSSGNIWITDINNYRVQKFDSSGSFLLTFGSQGTGNGQFEGPNYITTGSQ